MYLLCGSRKYPYPPMEGIGFSRGEGGSICLIFQWGGGGGHHREIFLEGSQSINQSTLFKHGKWLSKLVFRHAVR